MYWYPCMPCLHQFLSFVPLAKLEELVVFPRAARSMMRHTMGPLWGKESNFATKTRNLERTRASKLDCTCLLHAVGAARDSRKSPIEAAYPTYYY